MLHPSRSHGLHPCTATLAQEGIWHGAVGVVLVNQTQDVQEYFPLEVAREVGDLSVKIVQPNGKTLRTRREGLVDGPLMERRKLPAGRVVASIFGFDELGYHQLPGPGKYELRASLKTVGGVIHAPVVKLMVIEPAPDTIVASHPISLTGEQLKRPADARERAAVQQIKVEGRTFLFYRRFLSAKNGGEIGDTFRLAELPGKVELSVSGSHGEWGRLTITYKTSPGAEPTKLVINSISGSPWTDEEEKLLQEWWKGEAKPTTAPPAKP